MIPQITAINVTAVSFEIPSSPSPAVSLPSLFSGILTNSLSSVKVMSSSPGCGPAKVPFSIQYLN